MARRHGGVVVRPEFRGEDGAATMRIGPLVATDVHVNAAGIVYRAVGGGRTHWQAGREVVRDGAALVVLGDLGYTRLRIEPPRSAEHMRMVESDRPARREPDPEMKEVLDGLRSSRRAKGRGRALSREFAASWNARLNGAGVLETCGAAVVGGGRLVYANLDGGAMRDLRFDLAEGHRRRPAADLFAWLVESGNGQTSEWSKSFALVAPSIKVAAARVVTRLRFRDDLAGHLRELWLAAHLGSARDALAEAEAIIEGRALDSPARDCLGRLRAMAAPKRSGRAAACRRSTLGRRATGRSRGGGENAS